MTKPTTGPSSTAPMMTGTCRIVALRGPMGMMPSGVRPSTMVTAESMPATTSLRVFSRVFCMVFIQFFLRSSSVSWDT